MHSWQDGLRFGFQAFGQSDKWMATWFICAAAFILMILPRRSIGNGTVILLVFVGLWSSALSFSFFYGILIAAALPGLVAGMAVRIYAAYQQAEQATVDEERRKAGEAEAQAESERIEAEAQRRADVSRRSKTLSLLDDHFLTMRTAARAIDPAADGSMMVSTIDETLHTIRADPLLRQAVQQDEYQQQMQMIRDELQDKSVSDRFIYQAIDKLLKSAVPTD